MTANYNVYGPSGTCTMVRENDCVFEACDERRRKDSQVCVGGPLALYVYKIKHERKRVLGPTNLPAEKMPRYLFWTCLIPMCHGFKWESKDLSSLTMR